jgi:flagellar basal body P-ring formation protein FlgA
LLALAWSVLAMFSWPLAAAEADAVCRIQIRPRATIQNTAPVLADIADLSGPDEALVARIAQIPLGPVSDVRTFSRGEILALVRRVLPITDQVEIGGADFTRIALERRKPRAGEIDALLKEHLSSVTPWRKEEIEIRSIANLNSIFLPAGDVRLQVSSRGVPGNFQSMLLSVGATLDGKAVGSFWVKADVRVRARVVQAARRIPFRSVLAAGDLRELEREIADPRVECVRSLEAAAGMIVKRALAEGEVLTLRSVEPASLVHSGETIRLVAYIQGAQISTLVCALQNGRLGDRIKVRNIDSDRKLFAVVTGKGEVGIRQ